MGCADVDVLLPKNSLTMTEAEVLEWYVGEGEQAVAGEPLFLMETEKSQVVVEATASGRLTAIHCKAGDTAAAGEVIAVLDVGDEPGTLIVTAAGAERQVAPSAAELAAQLGIDLRSVRGSGSGGRVIEEDVVKAAQDGSPTAPAAGATHPGSTLPVSSRPATASKARTAGNRATVWAADVPTFNLAVTVTVPATPRPEGATVSDLLIAAAAVAAQQVPVANAYVGDDATVRLYDEVRVGLLVRDGDALVPLVFPAADTADLSALHSRRQELMAGIGGGQLPASATSWPTLVVSNIGRPAVRWFTAVLYPGTALTMAVGGVNAAGPDRAEVVVTCDHRVMDGLDAADFCAAFADTLYSL